jgi:hypothetical protein
VEPLSFPADRVVGYPLNDDAIAWQDWDDPEDRRIIVLSVRGDGNRIMTGLTEAQAERLYDALGAALGLPTRAGPSPDRSGR